MDVHDQQGFRQLHHVNRAAADQRNDDCNLECNDGGVKGGGQ